MVRGCWFEPLEKGVHAVQRARAGLIARGDLANAGYTYHETFYYLLDCAFTLDGFVAEAEAGLAFLARTGIEETGQSLEPYRWLAGVLRGERIAAAGVPVPIDRYADNSLARLHTHIVHAVAATVFGDLAALTRHTAAAMPLLAAAPGNYLTAVAHLLRGLALAEEAHATDNAGRGGLLSELDAVTRWLAARANDAPDNFLHLLRLLEAERGWAVGDFRAAASAFDTARREVATRQRPWHRALITEHAARFYLAHGLEYTGHELLAQARQHYAAWDASATADQLGWAYPTLRPHSDMTASRAATSPLICCINAARSRAAPSTCWAS